MPQHIAARWAQETAFAAPHHDHAYRQPRFNANPSQRCPVKHRRGHGAVLLYLDFDGVMHPDDVWWHHNLGPYLRSPAGHALFENSHVLGELLDAFPEVRVVLSTSWVPQYGLAYATKQLPPELRQRVIGATFHPRMDRMAFDAIPRWLQVYQDAQKRRPSGWVAIDDSIDDWPREQQRRLVTVNTVAGLAEPAVVAELSKRLAAMCGRPA